MNKAEFLDTLRRALSQLPPEELEKQIAYYEELFADMREDGLSEQEAAAKLGAEFVQAIGRKFVLYRPAEEKVIVLPR